MTPLYYKLVAGTLIVAACVLSSVFVLKSRSPVRLTKEVQNDANVLLSQNTPAAQTPSSPSIFFGRSKQSAFLAGSSSMVALIMAGLIISLAYAVFQYRSSSLEQQQLEPDLMDHSQDQLPPMPVTQRTFWQSLGTKTKVAVVFVMSALIAGGIAGRVVSLRREKLAEAAVAYSAVLGTIGTKVGRIHDLVDFLASNYEKINFPKVHEGHPCEKLKRYGTGEIVFRPMYLLSMDMCCAYNWITLKKNRGNWLDEIWFINLIKHYNAMNIDPLECLSISRPDLIKTFPCSTENIETLGRINGRLDLLIQAFEAIKKQVDETPLVKST